MSGVLSGALAIAAGVLAGMAGVAFSSARRDPAEDERTWEDDLDWSRRFLLERARELDADKEKLDTKRYHELRSEIERELADILKEAARRNQVKEEAAHRGEPSPSDRTSGGGGGLSTRPVLAGALWGAGTVAFLGALIWALTSGMTPRRDTMTGGVPDAGPASGMGTAPTPSPGGGPALGGADAAQLEVLRAEVSARPEDLDAALRLSHALLGIQQFGEAESLNNKVLAARPEDAEAKVHAALLLSARGEVAKGIEGLEKVLAGHPDHLEALLFRGMMAMQAGDREGAKKAWNHYLKVAPPDARSQRIQAMMGMLEGKVPPVPGSSPVPPPPP